MRRALRIVATWGVVVVITFMALEVVCRIADPLGISYYPETARLLDTLEVKKGRVGYRNRPGTTGTFYGASVRINSLGLRGPEIPSKASNEFRILLLGDSFPFGIGVSEEQCFPAVLERLLQKAAPPGLSVRVINMGTVSYNTEQELRQLREIGFGLAPEAVVLAYAMNDVQPVMWVLDKRRNLMVDLVQRSYAGSLVAILARNVKRALGGAPGEELAGHRADDPGWRAVDRSLTEINRLCRDKGITFLVFHAWQEPAVRTLVSDVGAREGFPVLEIFPSRDPHWGRIDPRRLVNSALDGHPNVEGNVMWAELLDRSLRGYLAPWRN